MRSWDEDWEQLAPRRRRTTRGHAHIGWVFAVVLATLLALIGATRWRDLTGANAPQTLPPAAATARDTLRARFALCGSGAHGSGTRGTCVIDGDTIWLNGEKIRLSDINAPEVSEPRCDYEQALGEKASDRLVVLLDAGPFSVTSEGLAEVWTGYRRDWCHR